MKPTHSDGTSAGMALWKWQRITRADDQPYLTRLILFRCPWFAVYLHRFVGNDDLCLHDHPWPFLSVILWGGYTEWTRHEIGHQRPRWYGPGSILFRPAEWAHRVQLGTYPLGHPKAGRNRPAITLVVTGRKVRGWGFHTAFGWIPWRQYHFAKHCPEE